jgi:hypothetical protein
MEIALNIYPNGYPSKARSRSALLKFGTAKIVKRALEVELNRLNAEVVSPSTQAFIEDVLAQEILTLDRYLRRKRLQAKKVIRCKPCNVNLSLYSGDDLTDLLNQSKELFSLCKAEKRLRGEEDYVFPFQRAREQEGFREQEGGFHIPAGGGAPAAVGRRAAPAGGAPAAVGRRAAPAGGAPTAVGRRAAPAGGAGGTPSGGGGAVGGAGGAPAGGAPLATNPWWKIW